MPSPRLTASSVARGPGPTSLPAPWSATTIAAPASASSPRPTASESGGLGSAPLPPLGAEDHVAGPPERPLAIVYADYECPYCAALEQRLAASGARRAFRHFPVRSKHPRAWAAACAAEAAALQGRFWEMHAALFADQGRLEDPHLWERAERLGLDVARFDADRRGDAVAARVRRDFSSGVRAGVVTTPTLFLDGVAHPGLASDELLARLG